MLKDENHCLIRSVLKQYLKLLVSIYFYWLWYRIQHAFAFKDFIYLFLEKGREGEMERNINVWLPLTCPLLGTWPATQACALGIELVTLWFTGWFSIHWATSARAEFSKLLIHGFVWLGFLFESVSYSWPYSVSCSFFEGGWRGALNVLTLILQLLSACSSLFSSSIC